ncbi:MAG TPA: outer membrane beta-barrel family protein [Bacteroidia bacterium]|nr:outer membrane beta-barrel family protein [Bacteroidia bacterium]HNU33331.1 outer membrane beta-barrel family protein [Bacteroidia bacterium]
MQPVHRRFKYYFLFLLLLCYAYTGSAQYISIRGTVTDTTQQTTVTNAVIMAVRLQDSLLTSFTRSNDSGNFYLQKLPIDTFQIIISHPLFSDKLLFVLGNNTETVIDFGKIQMPSKSITLNEVAIYGYRDPVYYKGDTLVYVADSFKVKENAVVEDLLKKLPGIKVDVSGKIFSQGKAVDQVLVDGDEFFGSDPTMATKNLAATSVETVNVYEKKNENATDGSTSETIKVLDLKLKEDAKKGYFGKVSAGTDFNQFFEGSALLNRFKGAQKISVFALQSNTPRSSFGWEDINQYGLNDERNSFSNDDGETYYWFGNNQPQAITTNLKTGIYFNDKITATSKLLMNYGYNQSDSKEESNSTSQYFLEDTTYFTKNQNKNEREQKNHTLNATIKQTLDSLTDLEITGRLKLSETESNRFDANNFLSNENVLTRSTSTNNNSSAKGNDWGTSAKLIKNFGKRERKFVASFGLAGVDNESEGILKINEQNLVDSSLEYDTTNQKKISENNRITHRASAEFTEPITQKIKIEISYDINAAYNKQNRQAFDAVGDEYITENSSLTNYFKTSRTVQRAGLKFIYDVKKQTLTIGSRFRNVFAKNENVSSNQSITQNINNILPYARYRYKFTDNQSLAVGYSTDSKQPDLTQLQPVTDNSNPNFITNGNPGLVPSYSHNFNLNYNQYKPVSQQSMWMGANFSFTNNAFANLRFIDSIGRTISTPVNVDGNYNVSAYANVNLSLFKKKLSLNPGADFNYTSNANFIDGKRNTSTNFSYNANTDITFETEKLELSAGIEAENNFTSSTINTLSDQRYSTIEYRSSLLYTFPKKLKFESAATYTTDSRRQQGYNNKILRIDASLEKTFFKSENLLVIVSVNDLLNKSISSRRTTEDNVTTDINSKVIARYILFKVVYKFKNKRKEGGDE